MPSYINGIDTSLITGLGQIGVTPVTASVYPSGGLIVNSGAIRAGTRITNGYNFPTASFYSRPYDMASASLGTSNWTKITGNTQVIYLLSSSGQLFAAGASSIYTGTGTDWRLSRVTTGSNWTDISAGNLFAIGICDGKLFAIGSNGNGQFGNGTTNSTFTNFAVVNNNTYWTKVSCGSAHAMAISGSGGSGSIFSAGSNASGRTGQNSTSGNMTTWTQVVNHTNRMFTDVSCGDDYSLAISGGNIFGTGENGDYTLGNNSTTDLTTFTLVSGSGIWRKVFAFTDFSKAIDVNTWHYHTGNELYSRGDGSTAQITTWTRLNTTGEFASGWQNFYANQLATVTYGTIGVKDNRPFYIGSRGSTTNWFPNTTWTDYDYSTNNATWLPFVSRSVNVSCSAAGWCGGLSQVASEPILFINLTPSS
jgi:hypothetical protein